MSLIFVGEELGLSYFVIFVRRLAVCCVLGVG
jgi:hypothetical protein